MIEFPFPPAVLSPNARPHYMEKARAFKKYKAACVALMLNARKALAGRNTFAVTFHPPTAHRFDLDNLIGRWKAGCDALAAITGVDDSEFILTFKKGEVRKGGAVVIA